MSQGWLARTSVRSLRRIISRSTISICVSTTFSRFCVDRSWRFASNRSYADAVLLKLLNKPTQSLATVVGLARPH